MAMIRRQVPVVFGQLAGSGKSYDDVPVSGFVGRLSAEVYFLSLQKSEDFAVVNANGSGFVYQNELSGRAFC